MSDAMMDVPEVRDRASVMMPAIRAELELSSRSHRLPSPDTRPRRW